MNERRDGGMIATVAAAGLLAVSAMKATNEPSAPRAGRSAADIGAASAADSGAGGVRDDIRGVREELALEEAGIKGRIERLQQRHRPVAFSVGVVKKFADDRANKLAALIAYFGFFSLFPALLALVTVLFKVLEHHTTLRTRIANSALAQFPVIGDDLSSALSKPPTGNNVALIVGLAGALWAGMGAMQNAQDGMNTVWGVPRAEWPRFLAKRARSLAGLLLIGAVLTATAVVPQLTGALSSGVFGVVLLLVASAAVDVGAFLVAFRVLTIIKVAWRELLPGAVVAGIAYLILQSVGTLYVTRALKGAKGAPGTFAVVIGLLSWLYLLAQVTMIAAEVNVVAARQMWPRSLFARPGSMPTPLATPIALPPRPTSA